MSPQDFNSKHSHYSDYQFAAYFVFLIALNSSDNITR